MSSKSEPEFRLNLHIYLIHELVYVHFLILDIRVMTVIDTFILNLMPFA